MKPPIRHILLDIEGTTCPVSYVAETLFPYASANLAPYLETHQQEANIRALIQELENAFRDFGIEARIYSVDGPQMLGRSHLEIPVHVRGEREVRLGAEPGRARESD
jgi:hypothetical protein